MYYLSVCSIHTSSPGSKHLTAPLMTDVNWMRLQVSMLCMLQRLLVVPLAPNSSMVEHGGCLWLRMLDISEENPLCCLVLSPSNNYWDTRRQSRLLAG
jgi:hypothetical protein